LHANIVRESVGESLHADDVEEIEVGGVGGIGFGGETTMRRSLPATARTAQSSVIGPMSG
jgi:hypothetical protein